LNIIKLVAGVPIASRSVDVIRGMRIPDVVLDTSSMALAAGGVAVVLIDTCPYKKPMHSMHIKVKLKFFILMKFYIELCKVLEALQAIPLDKPVNEKIQVFL
jgi:hypothetical protein